MPKYMLLLDNGFGRPVEETLVADDDVEARMLAELRLSLTTDYLQVSMVRDGQVLGTLTRDSVVSRRRRLSAGAPRGVVVTPPEGAVETPRQQSLD